VIYVNNEPLQIRNRAAAGECGDIKEVNVFTFAELGQLVSNGIVTNTAFATREPERVTAFAGAFDAGLRQVINNPAQAYLLSKEFVEDLPLSAEFKIALEELAAAQAEFLDASPDREAIAASRADMLATLQADFTPAELTQFEVLLNSIDLWDAEQLGYSAPEAWTNMQTTLTSMGIAQGTGDLTTLYTNDFLPVAE
jgi:ABC-type nitrate/sulfonate/bicarbonate transport system substrate-binding protein